MNNPHKTLFVAFVSIGVGLVVGGPVFGFIGQLLGYPGMWLPGIGAGVFGAVFAIIGGFGLLLNRNRSSNGRSRRFEN